MFGPLDTALWSGEFVLELAGAILASRYYRSIKIFWLYLAFRASADALGFSMMIGWGHGTYAWVDYGQRMIQYVVLGLLALRGIGAAMNVDDRSARSYSVLAVLLAVIGIVVAHGAQPWTKEYLLSIGEKADLALALMVGGALFMRECDVIVAPIKKPWAWVCWGLMIAVSTDAAARLLWHHGIIGGLATSRLMACGQIVALSVWIVAALQKSKEQVIVRASLGHQVEAMELPMVRDDAVHLWN